MPSSFRQMSECVIGVYSPRFNSYCQLNAIDYLLLVLAAVISILQVESALEILNHSAIEDSLCYLKKRRIAFKEKKTSISQRINISSERNADMTTFLNKIWTGMKYIIPTV